MEVQKDCILTQDLEAVVMDTLDVSSLQGCYVLVTGATGLIGSLTVKALLRYNEAQGVQVHVLAMVRSREKAEEVFGIQEGEFLTFVEQDINQPIHMEYPVDYIIHGASVTASKAFVEYPVETIFTAMDGTRNILELAREKNTRSMVYLSSLEVYGTSEGERPMISEDDYGYIDHLSVRSSYSEGKRMVECLCASYYKEYGVPVRIARLSQTFGAGVSYEDTRVFAEFARAAIEKKDIILHTDGATTRNYCYTSDAVRALFYILLKGASGEAYNVANKDTIISIRDMARLVAENIAEGGIQVRIETEEDLSKYGYNPKVIACLKTDKLEALGWNAKVGIEEMLKNTISAMKGKRNEFC